MRRTRIAELQRMEAVAERLTKAIRQGWITALLVQLRMMNAMLGAQAKRAEAERLAAGLLPYVKALYALKRWEAGRAG